MPKARKAVDRKPVANEDTPHQGKEFFKRAQPVASVMPDLAEHAQMKRARGRPAVERPKVQISLRLDANVLAGFKAGGKGWQSRISDVLAASLVKERSRKRG